MTTPRVTELPRRLEPTDRDSFLELPLLSEQMRTETVLAATAVEGWDQDRAPEPEASHAIHQSLGEHALSDAEFAQAVAGLEQQPVHA